MVASSLIREHNNYSHFWIAFNERYLLLLNIYDLDIFTGQLCNAYYNEFLIYDVYCVDFSIL